MSYTLIRKINDQLLREVPSRIFPFQYGTIGSLMSALMIPVLGTEALTMLQNDWKHTDLNVAQGSLEEMQQYLENQHNTALTEATQKLFHFINDQYLGVLQTFFEEDVWQMDNALAPILEGKEEFRDTLLLFVFSAPVFPVSLSMREVMLHFHVFEIDEPYMEVQAILNEYYNDTAKCQRIYLAWKYLETLSNDAGHKVMDKIQETVPFTCDGCGKNIKSLKNPYISRIEVYPSRSEVFDQEDEDKNFAAEVSSMLEMVGQKAEREMTKEMWTEYRLFLCNECRITFIKRIENGEFI
jgi:hypothetical protein